MGRTYEQKCECGGKLKVWNSEGDHGSECTQCGEVIEWCSEHRVTLKRHLRLYGITEGINDLPTKTLEQMYNLSNACIEGYRTLRGINKGNNPIIVNNKLLKQMRVALNNKRVS